VLAIVPKAEMPAQKSKTGQRAPAVFVMMELLACSIIRWCNASAPKGDAWSMLR
jgi:hypothetical protein